MKRHEYDNAQQLILLCAQGIDGLPFKLDEFIAAIERAESTGPVLDPTLYMKGKDNLEQIKIIAKAARRFKKEVQPALEVLRENQSTNNQ